MNKIKKLIKSPNLFFRDYFLKRQPINYGNNVSLLELENPKTSTLLTKNKVVKKIVKPKIIAKKIIEVVKPGMPDLIKEDIYPITFPIDVVYTWVDSDDISFIENKRKYEELFHEKRTSNHHIKSEVFDNARFQSRDELKYSIRSLQAFAPWINKIYIVTNGQIPKWLNLNDSRIRVVPHSEIIEEKFLPTFNSHVIESCLYKINGLSENFLYLNDDVMLSRPIIPNYFYWSNGNAKLFITNSELPNGAKGVYDTPTQWAAKNARELIFQKLQIYVSRMFAHTFHPQLKSIHQQLEINFSEAYEQCRMNKFRSHNDIPVATFLHHHYSYITGAATLHSTSCMYFNIRAAFAMQCYKSLLARKGTSKAPYSMCLNDHVSEGNSFMKDYEEKLGNFLESYFSMPSPYEMQIHEEIIANEQITSEVITNDVR